MDDDDNDEEKKKAGARARASERASSGSPTRIPLRQLSSPSTSSSSLCRDLSGRSRSTRGCERVSAGCVFES